MSDKSSAENRIGVSDLPDSVSYTVKGETRTKKMSFALLNKLMQKLGNVENVKFVGLDAGVDDMLMCVFLTERDQKGKPVDGVELESTFELGLSMEDAENIIGFIQMHMADFCLRALHRAAALAAKSKDARAAMAPLVAGLTGMQLSLSEKPAS